jgi:hypothetical protein
MKDIRFACSLFTSLTINCSHAWLSKFILKSTFMQPFHSLDKRWPSSTATTNGNLNKVLEKKLYCVT